MGENRAAAWGEVFVRASNPVTDDEEMLALQGDAKELSACVRKLLEDPALFSELAERGRKRVLENYTQEQIARQTYEAYQEMIDMQVGTEV